MITHADFFRHPEIGSHGKHVDRLVLCVGGQVFAVGPPGACEAWVDGLEEDLHYDASGRGVTRVDSVVGTIYFDELEKR